MKTQSTISHIVCIVALLGLSTTTTKAEETLQFPDACANGKQIVIAAVGDLLFHYPLQRKAMDSGFESLWQKTLPFIQAATIAYGNLEGPIGAGLLPSGKEVNDPFDWQTYFLSRFPSFNYHPSVASALKTSGFQIVSNANNHILDRGALGIDKTLEILEHNHIAHIGARAKNTNTPWHVILERDGVKIAWLACAEHTNGITDKFNQVLHCYRSADRSTMVSTIQTLKKQVDVIIVAPHWGEEYQTLIDPHIF